MRGASKFSLSCTFRLLRILMRLHGHPIAIAGKVIRAVELPEWRGIASTARPDT